MRVRNTAGPHGGRGLRRAGAAGAGVVAALALATGCMSEDADPRAYPGSPKGQTLEKVAKAFGLDLPSCDMKDVGFYGSGKYPEESLYLSFRAPKDCVDGFLAAHSADPTDPVHWTPGNGSKTGFNSDTATRTFGWSLDDAVTYDLFVHFKTSTGSRFSVLADPGQTERTVYMESAFVGGS